MSKAFENIASSDNSLYTALGTVFCKSLCSKAAQGFTNNFNSNTPDLIAQRPSLTYLSIPASPKAGDYVIRLPFRKRLARAVLIWINEFKSGATEATPVLGLSRKYARLATQLLLVLKLMIDNADQILPTLFTWSSSIFFCRWVGPQTPTQLLASCLLSFASTLLYLWNNSPKTITEMKFAVAKAETI